MTRDHIATTFSLNSELRTLDSHFLAHAIQLAATGLGRTWPNPSVGCVLVKDGHVLAAARSADGGRPHAETQALAAAGDHARGATAYVSLEPCAHQGQTGPCAEAVIQAGIARVVIAAIDPDPRVQGKGIAMLQAAGIEVSVAADFLPPRWGETERGADAKRGLDGEALPLGSPPSNLPPMGGGTTDAAALLYNLHRGFYSRVQYGIPYVAAKIAGSLDGHIADAQGESQWITSGTARSHAHRLRAQFDAILTGIGTVLADDPELTVRLPGIDCRHMPRIVADRRLRLPLDSKLVKSAEQQPVWVATTPEAIELAANHATDLRERGVVIHVVEVPGSSFQLPAKETPSLRGAQRRDNPAREAPLKNWIATSPRAPRNDDASSPETRTLEPETWNLEPKAILHTLAGAGITRLLLEAGPTLTTAFLAADAIDTLHWYRAPLLLGNAGKPAVNALDTSLSQAARVTSTESRPLGPDRYEMYELKSCSQD